MAYATIAGGRNNLISGTSFGSYAALGGGRDNTVLGRYATIPGGEAERSHRLRLRGWSKSQGSTCRCFCLGRSSTDQDEASTTNDQFLVRAAGGAAIAQQHERRLGRGIAFRQRRLELARLIGILAPLRRGPTPPGPEPTRQPAHPNWATERRIPPCGTSARRPRTSGPPSAWAK